MVTTRSSAGGARNAELIAHTGSRLIDVVQNSESDLIQETVAAEGMDLDTVSPAGAVDSMDLDPPAPAGSLLNQASTTIADDDEIPADSVTASTSAEAQNNAGRQDEDEEADEDEQEHDLEEDDDEVDLLVNEEQDATSSNPRPSLANQALTSKLPAHTRVAFLAEKARVLAIIHNWDQQERARAAVTTTRQRLQDQQRPTPPEILDGRSELPSPVPHRLFLHHRQNPASPLSFTELCVPKIVGWFPHVRFQKRQLLCECGSALAPNGAGETCRRIYDEDGVTLLWGWRYRCRGTDKEGCRAAKGDNTHKTYMSYDNHILRQLSDYYRRTFGYVLSAKLGLSTRLLDELVAGLAEDTGISATRKRISGVYHLRYERLIDGWLEHTIEMERDKEAQADAPLRQLSLSFESGESRSGRFDPSKDPGSFTAFNGFSGRVPSVNYLRSMAVKEQLRREPLLNKMSALAPGEILAEDGNIKVRDRRRL